MINPLIMLKSDSNYMELAKDRRGISATGMTPRQYFEDQISGIIASHPEKIALLKQQIVTAQNLLEAEEELKGQTETFIAFVTTMSELGIIERRNWLSAAELHDFVKAIGRYKFGPEK